MLQECADTIIVVPNDRLMHVLQRGTSMVDAFKVCDDLLRQGVQGITDLITLPGLINLDFADVRTIIRGAGAALLGIGYAGGGNRATEAAQAAIESPLLETPIDGARGILLGITGGPDLSLLEVSEAARVVSDAADPEANIIFGATIDPDLEGQVWVTVVAANFSGHRAAPPRPPVERERPAPPQQAPPQALGSPSPRPPEALRAPVVAPPRPAPRMTSMLEKPPAMDEPPEAPDLSALADPSVPEPPSFADTPRPPETAGGPLPSGPPAPRQPAPPTEVGEAPGVPAAPPTEGGPTPAAPTEAGEFPGEPEDGATGILRRPDRPGDSA
jgi:hypothetical protein